MTWKNGRKNKNFYSFDLYLWQPASSEAPPNAVFLSELTQLCLWDTYQTERRNSYFSQQRMKQPLSLRSQWAKSDQQQLSLLYSLARFSVLQKCHFGLCLHRLKDIYAWCNFINVAKGKLIQLHAWMEMSCCTLFCIHDWIKLLIVVVFFLQIVLLCVYFKKKKLNLEGLKNLV